MRKLVILLIIFNILNGCNSKYPNVVEIDNFDNENLEFNQLPKNVQEVYEHFAKVELLNDTLINKISSLKIELYKPTLHKDQFGLLREGFNHIFVIENKYALKLKANKGDPFVFENNSLFYTEELNQDTSNYDRSIYVKIDLSDVMSKIDKKN